MIILTSNFYNQVTQIINEWDPARLIALEFPRNEYNIEVNQICNFVRRNKNQDVANPSIHELALFISKVMNEYFDFDYLGTEEQLIDVSQKILELNINN